MAAKKPTWNDTIKTQIKKYGKPPKTKQYRGLIDKWAQDRVTVRDTPAKNKK